MIEIERLERFVELQKMDEENMTDSHWDEYYDLMRQIAFDLSCELWQDEDASGILMTLLKPPHPYDD